MNYSFALSDRQLTNVIKRSYLDFLGRCGAVVFFGVEEAHVLVVTPVFGDLVQLLAPASLLNFFCLHGSLFQVALRVKPKFGHELPRAHLVEVGGLGPTVNRNTISGGTTAGKLWLALNTSHDLVSRRTFIFSVDFSRP